MKYLSVCSGIEAATVAWHSFGWTPVAFSEIEPFPSAVLAHHYPEVPNLGDMTKHEEWNLGSIDLLVGGTPCQSFSVAGLRKGLADPRGNLMLTYLAIAERRRPRWIVWENVPGVLSSNGGRDFGTFLAALGQLGYGYAYRVLDAQWFGVAQRRRRVFVVGYFGDWRRAAAVLFERESVRRDTPPSRETRETTAGRLARSTYLGNAEGGSPGVPFLTCSNIANHVNNQTPLVGTYAKTHKPASREDADGWSLVEAAPTITHWPRDRSDAGTDVAVVRAYIQEISDPITANEGRTYTHEGTKNFRTRNVQAIPIHDQATRFADKRGDKHAVTHTLRGEGFDAGEDGTGRGVPIVQVGQSSMHVRRLTPTECERLQGFPDGYTNIPWKKSREAPDGPRYKSLGNSMAVPVMRWIGRRIDVTETIATQEAANE